MGKSYNITGRSGTMKLLLPQKNFAPEGLYFQKKSLICCAVTSKKKLIGFCKFAGVKGLYDVSLPPLQDKIDTCQISRGLIEELI